ncbi:hypothetical protein HPP92_002519 [Vanilla planifolia]|uniref:Sec39 domain-containing protein n=1 Tax=Vanilla planifolia TaxID=51239 RepID=A0A835VKN6_VANPL|nr:hypothetical protein HPP92_002519 [Vanilla planifolia]
MVVTGYPFSGFIRGSWQLAYSLPISVEPSLPHVEEGKRNKEKNLGKRFEMEQQRLKADEEVFYDVRQHAVGVNSPDFFLEQGRWDSRRDVVLSYNTRLSFCRRMMIIWNHAVPMLECLRICTADGVIHRLEVGKDPGVCISSIMISDGLFKEKLLQTICCVDFHPDLSLVVLLGAVNDPKNSRNSTRFYSLFVLQLCSNSNLKLLFCTPQFEGVFSSTKGHVASLTSPKLSFSPHGKYIATLDLTGCVDVLDFDSTRSYLSMLCSTSRLWSPSSEDALLGRKNDLTDIVDLAWWSDHVLLLAHSSGCVILYDVLSNIVFHKEVPHFCMPVMERPKHSQGQVFVLNSSEIRQTGNKQIDRKISLEKNLVDGAIINWSLVGIYKKSVLEMYSILISNEQYDAALEFADSHGLDRDEVFKAQWLRSSYGTKDVDMFLSQISDRTFVLSECIHKIGPSEEAVKALLSYGIHLTEDCAFSNLSNEESSLLWETRVTRLQLLQYRDKLDTFVGINMGRFLAEEYGSFRVVPIAEAAVNLAESGKIGALKLLFKRHPYSLCPVILNVLSVIPETVPVQSYDQLLPGRTPPVAIALRQTDWVECEGMVSFLDKMIGKPDWLIQVRTENMMKLSMGFCWPSITELIDWYKNRSLDIDRQSGQLENCLALVEVACRKGISELQHFLEDITYLHQLVYASECNEDFTLGLVEWEKLSAYEKFRMLLKGATEESAVEILREKAIPFMQNRSYPVQVNLIGRVNDEGSLLGHGHSFLIRWMKEIAANNNLEMCLKIIENGCGESPIIGLFKDEAEITDIALECIYSCMLTDQWSQMASILSKLPCKTLREKNPKDTDPKYDNLGSLTPRFLNIRNQLSKSLRHSNSVNTDEEGSEHCYSEGTDMVDFTLVDDSLEKRVKKAEGHVEAGRILEYYQVPKPICFFLSAESDEKTVKQLIRLLLSKFGRRQPGKSDGDWSGLWNDMLCLQEKAFPFLDTEYMLIEFCRGLLKAGAGNIALASEKADFLVVQAAREYFFSASTLTCPEIWKAKDCLNLCPNSKLVQSELDVIEALTVRLPNLGVTLLPMQFKQIRNHMEIIMMVISSQKGAYLNVEELIDVAKLLGLGSPDDIAAVEEAAAREAAVAGDLQVALELCLVLAKKGHGAIWDLCVAIARGPNLDNIDTGSRKQLLGFALCHCDQESIGELLRAWKEVDMHMHFEQLMLLTKSCPPNFSSHGCSLVPLPCNSLRDILSLRETSEPSNDNHMEDETYLKVQFDSLKTVLSRVADECLNEGGISWESLKRKLEIFVIYCIRTSMAS